MTRDWLSPKLEVRESEIEGKGLFAKEDIALGEVLVKFGGSFTDQQGAEEQRQKGKLVMQWDVDLFSYEDRGDDQGYFINHSCDANMWMEDAYTLTARRDIQSGEEITADYALWEAGDFISRWECRCGSALCRGRVTGKDWQDPALQQRYQDHFSPLINKRIQGLV